MKVVLATHNKGKIKEFQNAFQEFDIDFLSASDLDLQAPEENGQTFEENAYIKAFSVYEQTGLASLADDSGLSVNALNGDPGVYSARWAGPQGDFSSAMQRIVNELQPYDDWTASFQCSLAFVQGDTAPLFAYGEVKGKIVWPPAGSNGFGYDPIFEPDAYPNKTFAELDIQQKQSISHRGQAIANLIHKYFT